jgi:hypothetical protein
MAQAALWDDIKREANNAYTNSGIRGHVESGGDFISDITGSSSKYEKCIDSIDPNLREEYQNLEKIECKRQKDFNTGAGVVGCIKGAVMQANCVQGMKKEQIEVDHTYESWEGDYENNPYAYKDFQEVNNNNDKPITEDIPVYKRPSIKLSPPSDDLPADGVGEANPNLPLDGRNQFHKGANMDATTWKVVRMTDDPNMFKVVDSQGTNVADLFHSQKNAEQYIAYYKWLG